MTAQPDDKAAGAEDPTFRTSRVLSHPVSAVFEAFTTPETLAMWWGPKGFRNAFETCNVQTGGGWRYVMHGPNGAQFRNESVFDLVTETRIVIRHVSKPCYVLTVTLAPHETGTLVTWEQVFDEAAVAARIRHIVTPANEENLDRLTATLAARRE
jgi:uncharacterized protein YndB with AHSA1/START domain